MTGYYLAVNFLTSARRPFKPTVLLKTGFEDCFLCQAKITFAKELVSFIRPGSAEGGSAMAVFTIS
jgi:hypothetical protein